MCCCLSHIRDSRVHESKGENVSGPTTITSSDPQAKCVLPVPETLSSADPNTLVPEGGMFPPGEAMVTPLIRKQRLPPGHFGLLLSISLLLILRHSI